MSDNLNPKQFKWVPDQVMRHSIGWHILKWHIKANENGAKGHALSGRSTQELHDEHMKLHEDGSFEEGHEHKHFTPKNRK